MDSRPYTAKQLRDRLKKNISQCPADKEASEKFKRFMGAMLSKAIGGNKTIRYDCTFWLLGKRSVTTMTLGELVGVFRESHPELEATELFG